METSLEDVRTRGAHGMGPDPDWGPTMTDLAAMTPESRTEFIVKQDIEANEWERLDRAGVFTQWDARTAQLRDADFKAGAHARLQAEKAARPELEELIRRGIIAELCAPDTHDERRYLSALHDCHGETAEITDANYLSLIQTIIRNTKTAQGDADRKAGALEYLRKLDFLFRQDIDPLAASKHVAARIAELEKP